MAGRSLVLASLWDDTVAYVMHSWLWTKPSDNITGFLSSHLLPVLASVSQHASAADATLAVAL